MLYGLKLTPLLEQMQIHLDNLNLLYVAFTRVEAQLYLMAPLPEQGAGMATIADLIYQSLQQAGHLSGESGPWAADIEETASGY